MTATARLYRYDAILDSDVLVATSSNTGADTTYVETTASTACLPGSYRSEGDFTIFWAGGGSASGTLATGSVVIPCI